MYILLFLSRTTITWWFLHIDGLELLTLMVEYEVYIHKKATFEGLYSLSVSHRPNYATNTSSFDQNAMPFQHGSTILCFA